MCGATSDSKARRWKDAFMRLPRNKSNVEQLDLVGEADPGLSLGIHSRPAGRSTSVHFRETLSRASELQLRMTRAPSAVPTEFAATLASRSTRMFEVGSRNQDRAGACMRKGSWGGQASVRDEPVAGRLRRPYGVCPKRRALPPLYRGGSGAGGQRVRSPDV